MTAAIGTAARLTNDDLARRLRAHARALADRGDNLYRVRAFRQAAMAVLGLRESVADVLARTGTVPGVGESVAETLERFVRTGEWNPDRESAGRSVAHPGGRANGASAVAVGRKTPAGGTDHSVPPAEFTAV
jgi:DNA polymerase (family 10)